MACSAALGEVLVEQTGGYPADTMEVCQQLYLLALAGGQAQLDLSLVHLAVDEADARLRTIFDELWAELSVPAYSRLVAARIARGEPPTALATGATGSIAPKLLVSALGSLAAKGIVERLTGGRYEFSEPLFKRYVLDRAT